MATIELRLFATLAIKTPPDALEYNIEPGLSVAGLLEKLKISPEEAKLVFINGVRCELSTALSGGERVGIFPPVGGG
jgi:molybdopterin converting factor small subunit